MRVLPLPVQRDTVTTTTQAVLLGGHAAHTAFSLGSPVSQNITERPQM